ncbi:MAG: hypothetical protein MJK12_06870 [Colwellia sp.]|nr:hypothetical protein [Colwellia sp.]
MKLKLILLTAMLFTQTVSANNKQQASTETLAQVGVSVKIYPLKEASKGKLSVDELTQIIANSEAEYSPGLVVEEGKTAEISINNSDKNNDIDELKIKFHLNKTANKYAIDVELYQDQSNSISSVTDIDVGSDLIFTAKINDIAKIIKVKTIAIEGSLAETLAKSRLQLTRSTFIISEAQQYFQEDKVWDTSKRRINDLKNNNGRIMGNNSNFYYLTNNDNTRLIKGAVKIQRANNIEPPTSVQFTGLYNYSLSDNLLEFIVLPQQSVLLGRWWKSLQIEVVAADFLSAEETEQLKAKHEKNQ